MRLQVSFGYELALTQLAREWSFSCMRAHMRLEVARLSEFF